jgi:DNA-binding CsgD family transcriptional regulator
MDARSDSVFRTLTDKQHEALVLACAHLTSKQIAIKLGVAPVTIDKRIDGIRAKLGNISRVELLHLYQMWQDGYDRIVPDPIILPLHSPITAQDEPQLAEHTYHFEDSLAFDARTSWDRSFGLLRPGIRPSDLGVSGKLLAMLAGSVAILMAVVLSLAVVTSLGTMLKV